MRWLPRRLIALVANAPRIAKYRSARNAATLGQPKPALAATDRPNDSLFTDARASAFGE
jgi:hypothetical protein